MEYGDKFMEHYTGIIERLEAENKRLKDYIEEMNDYEPLQDKETIAQLQEELKQLRIASTWIPFNINHEVRVRLTDKGRRVLLDNHNSLYANTNLPQPPKYIPPKEDEEGWSVWQLWYLINQLGNHFVMGLDGVIETEIEITLV